MFDRLHKLGRSSGNAPSTNQIQSFRLFRSFFSLSLPLPLFLVSLFLLRSRYEETSTGTANTDRTEFGWSRAGTMPRKSWNAGYNFVSGQRRVHYTEPPCVPHRFAAIIRRVPLVRPCLEAPNDEILHEMRIDKKKSSNGILFQRYIWIFGYRVIF